MTKVGHLIFVILGTHYIAVRAVNMTNNLTTNLGLIRNFGPTKDPNMFGSEEMIANILMVFYSDKSTDNHTGPDLYICTVKPWSCLLFLELAVPQSLFSADYYWIKEPGFTRPCQLLQHFSRLVSWTCIVQGGPIFSDELDFSKLRSGSLNTDKKSASQLLRSKNCEVFCWKLSSTGFPVILTKAPCQKTIVSSKAIYLPLTPRVQATGKKYCSLQVFRSQGTLLLFQYTINKQSAMLQQLEKWYTNTNFNATLHFVKQPYQQSTAKQYNNSNQRQKNNEFIIKSSKQNWYSFEMEAL